MLDGLIEGFAQLLTVKAILLLWIGVVLGTIMGAIPGLTAIMAVALIIPITYDMPLALSVALLMGAYKGGLFGGAIPAVLFSTPGTPAAAATLLDGYPLSRQGKGLKALKAALVASVSGDMLGNLLAILLVAQVARWALAFGPGEYAVLILFAMTIIGAVAGRSLLHGLMGGTIGLLLSTVGLDPMAGTPRFSFGIPHLFSGFDIMALLIGLLAVSELFVQLERPMKALAGFLPKAARPEDDQLTISEIRPHVKTMIKSTFIGASVGALPGMGAEVSSFLAYNEAKRTSKHPERYGTGELNGVFAAESGNSSVSPATLIPLLGLGVPGDVASAVLVGAFMVQGIAPGPQLLVDRPDVVYGIYAGLILANIILLITCWPLLRFFARLATAPRSLLLPVVLAFCVLGAYAVNQSLFDIWVMLAFGLFGYVLRKFHIPPTPVLIGFVLGPLLEKSIRQALLISQGSWTIFFQSPITWLFWGLFVVTILSLRRMRKSLAAAEKQLEAAG